MNNINFGNKGKICINNITGIKKACLDMNKMPHIENVYRRYYIYNFNGEQELKKIIKFLLFRKTKTSNLLNGKIIQRDSLENNDTINEVEIEQSKEDLGAQLLKRKFGDIYNNETKNNNLKNKERER